MKPSEHGAQKAPGLSACSRDAAFAAASTLLSMTAEAPPTSGADSTDISKRRVS